MARKKTIIEGDSPLEESVLAEEVKQEEKPAPAKKKIKYTIIRKHNSFLFASYIEDGVKYGVRIKAEGRNAKLDVGDTIYL